MILPDVNLLIYAFNLSAPQHDKAARWWEAQINSGVQIGVCWPVFQAFVRLLTGRHIVEDPYTAEDLFAIADEWWRRPNLELVGPSRETYRLFRELMENQNLSGSAATDALIAAYTLEHRGTLHSNDTDFLRFPGLRVVNPLSGRPR